MIKITFQPSEPEWLKIDIATGKVLHLDWDFAERLAQAHRDNIRQDYVTVSALLCCAVRDYVLEAKIPDWQGDKK